MVDPDPITDCSDDSDAISQFDDDDDTEAPGLDMSHIFSAVSLPVATSVLSQSTGAGVSKSLLPSADLSHTALLWLALDDSGLSRRPEKNRRVSGKQPVDVKMLRLLCDKPELVTLAHRCSKDQQTKAHNEYRRWYIRATGCKWKDATPLVLTAFRTLTNDQRYHWYLVNQGRGLYSLDVSDLADRRRLSLTASSVSSGSVDGETKSAAQASDVHIATGLLLTYFPKIGQDDPTVLGWVHEGLRGDDLRQKLMTLPVYLQYFQSFTTFIRDLSRQLGFSSCCCSMEMGESSRFIAMVHCHAYMSFIKPKCGCAEVKHLRVPHDTLVFCGLTPYTVLTKGPKGRRLLEAMRQGMHYVIGPKNTGMFRYTDCEPVQDPRFNMHVSPRIRYPGQLVDSLCITNRTRKRLSTPSMYNRTFASFELSE